MHLKLIMQVIKVIKLNFFKICIMFTGVMVVGFTVHSNKSIQSKMQRISFPGVTHINLNRSIKELRLSKLNTEPDQRLIENLVDRRIKLSSALFFDPQLNLMVAIGENLTDQQLVFVVIKKNQVTQIQKINELTDQYISLQYGKITIDAQTMTASKITAFENL